MPSEKWIARHTNDNFWLEASFLTLWGAERSLQRARFVRSLHDFNGFRSYLKFWSSRSTPSPIFIQKQVEPVGSRLPSPTTMAGVTASEGWRIR